MVRWIEPTESDDALKTDFNYSQKVFLKVENSSVFLVRKFNQEQGAITFQFFPHNNFLGD